MRPPRRVLAFVSRTSPIYPAEPFAEVAQPGPLADENTEMP